MNIEITRQINLLFAIKRRRKIKRSQSIASNTWTDSSLRGKFKRGWSRVNYREGLSQYIWCFHRENTHTQERKKKRGEKLLWILEMYLSMDRRALAHIDPRSFRLLFLFTICVPIRVSSFNFSSPYLPSRSFHRQSIKYNHSFLFLNYLNLLLRAMNAGSVCSRKDKDALFPLR